MSRRVTPSMWIKYWKVAGLQNDGMLNEEQIKTLVDQFRVKGSRTMVKYMNQLVNRKREGLMVQKRFVHGKLHRSPTSGRFARKPIVATQVHGVCSEETRTILLDFMTVQAKRAKNSNAFTSSFEQQPSGGTIKYADFDAQLSTFSLSHTAAVDTGARKTPLGVKRAILAVTHVISQLSLGWADVCGSSSASKIALEWKNPQSPPTRAFINVYENDGKPHGAKEHVDQGIRYGTAVIKIAGGEDDPGSSLTLHSAAGTCKAFSLPDGSAVLFASRVLHSVPNKIRDTKRITLNLFF